MVNDFYRQAISCIEICYCDTLSVILRCHRHFQATKNLFVIISLRYFPVILNERACPAVKNLFCKVFE